VSVRGSTSGAAPPALSPLQEDDKLNPVVLAVDPLARPDDGEDGDLDSPPAAPPTLSRSWPGAESVLTFLVVAAAVLFTFTQLHPSLLLANTTPNGGDLGAHVWAPDFVKRVLLPQGRILGWAPDWYAGFPALSFYFPLPTLAIVALDVVLPYGIAFKLVSVAGILTLPIAVWAFARLSRSMSDAPGWPSPMPFPAPVLMSVASVGFLFERGFTIYGGNIASTLAGEFTFSIGLSLAFVFLGVVASGLHTGRRRALAAGLLAATGLCHLLPTIFAVAGAGLLYVFQPGRRRLRWTAAVLAVGGLLAAFWSFPFLMRMPYANDMGWEKLVDYQAQLVPAKLRWLVALALVGAAFSINRARRIGLFLVGMASVAALVFRFAPQGRLWNARALPFWFLCIYLLAALALAELGPALARGLSRDANRPGLLARLATPLGGALAVWLLVGQPLGVIPSWLPVPKASETSFVPGWAQWNYSGYERKPAYPEYRDVIDTMAAVGRSRGCGRAHWEYEQPQDRFGTPMALMLLPFWTKGCIGSMEGLYFESSATTPYHFLNSAELSVAPSNPQRDLPYVSPALDVDSGVSHLQLMGVRYYLAFSPQAVADADEHPDLTLVAGVRQWRVYEVAGSDLVEPLRYEPAVLRGVAKGGKEWLGVGVRWYTTPSDQEVMWAAAGPARWARIDVTQPSEDTKPVGTGVTVEEPPRRALPEVTVSRIRTDARGNVSFSVDRLGVPVLVKTSYFPNWRASGAEGPWRVAPNLMVVVPRAHDVKLHYAWTPVEVVGWVLTGIGLVGIVLWLRRPRRADGDGAVDGAPGPSSETPEPTQAAGDGTPGGGADAWQWLGDSSEVPVAAPAVDPSH